MANKKGLSELISCHQVDLLKFSGSFDAAGEDLKNLQSIEDKMKISRHYYILTKYALCVEKKIKTKNISKYVKK